MQVRPGRLWGASRSKQASDPLGHEPLTSNVINFDSKDLCHESRLCKAAFSLRQTWVPQSNERAQRARAGTSRTSTQLGLMQGRPSHASFHGSTPGWRRRYSCSCVPHSPDNQACLLPSSRFLKHSHHPTCNPDAVKSSGLIGAVFLHSSR